jgi:hypothetical protein
MFMLASAMLISMKNAFVEGEVIHPLFPLRLDEIIPLAGAGGSAACTRISRPKEFSRYARPVSRAGVP